MTRRQRGPSPSLVTFPGLVVRRHGRAGGVTLANQSHGTLLEASDDVLEILSFFREPATVASFFESFDVDPAILDELQRQAVLVDPAKLGVLRGGLLQGAGAPFGAKTYLRDLDTAPRGRDSTFAIVGAPFELGVTCEGGARGGPREIRTAMPIGTDPEGRFPATLLDVNARRRVSTEGVRVLDLGDLQALPQEGLDAVGARLRHVVDAVLDAAMVPIVLGGDHALTHFALESVIAKHGPIGILHFDAHLDLNGTAPWLNHANVFFHALARPEVKALRQVGVRAYEVLTGWERVIPDRRLSWVTAREVGSGLSPAQVLRGLPRNLPYYLTFDVDVLDPQVAPETGAPVAGGLRVEQLLPIVDAAARALRIVGADFMEVATAPTKRNAAAMATGRILTELLLARCRRTTLRPSKLGTPRSPG